MASQVMLAWWRDMRSHASGGSCRALEMRYGGWITLTHTPGVIYVDREKEKSDEKKKHNNQLYFHVKTHTDRQSSESRLHGTRWSRNCPCLGPGRRGGRICGTRPLSSLHPQRTAKNTAERLSKTFKLHDNPKPINQSTDRTLNQSLKRKITQSINQSKGKSPIQSINQRVNHPINQSNNRSSSKLFNQSINRSNGSWCSSEQKTDGNRPRMRLQIIGNIIPAHPGANWTRAAPAGLGLLPGLNPYSPPALPVSQRKWFEQSPGRAACWNAPAGSKENSDRQVACRCWRLGHGLSTREEKNDHYK